MGFVVTCHGSVVSCACVCQCVIPATSPEHSGQSPHHHNDIHDLVQEEEEAD